MFLFYFQILLYIKGFLAATLFYAFLSEIHSFHFCFYHLRSDGAIDSAVVFHCFRGGVLCFLYVSPYIAEIQDVVDNARLDLFPVFAKYFSGCFLYNTLEVVGQDVYVFFEKN